MSYYLDVPNITNRTIDINIPAPVDSGGYNFEFEFEVRLTSTELIIAAALPASANDIIFIKPTVIEYRSTGNATINMTHGVNTQQWHVYRMVFTGSGQGNIAFYVDGAPVNTYTPSANVNTPAYTALLSFSSATRVGSFRYFKFTDFNNSASNRMFDARAYVSGDTVLRDTANNQNGTFSVTWAALPPNFVDDTPVVAPISFTGTIPTQSFTSGQAVSVDLSGYFTGTETPFTFANTGAALTGSGLTISSAGLLSGTYNGTEITGVIITGTDTATNTANSNAFNIQAAAVPQVPQGTVTIGSITVTETTATVPYSYSAADQTGFEYRINGGAPVADAVSPVNLTGLNPSTEYTIEVRAVNATGAGAWSTSAGFTTDAPTVNGRIVFSATNALTDLSNTLYASQSGFIVTVNNPSDGELIARFTGQSTQANGVMNTIESALLPVAAEVRITITAPDGAECVFRETTQ